MGLKYTGGDNIKKNISSELIEHITHQTQSRPFSIHFTDVSPYMELALYLHCHKEMELFYLEQGEVIFYIEDLSFKLSAGDAIFIPPNLIHSAKKYKPDKSHCTFYAIVFSENMLIDILPSYCEHYLHPVMYNGINCVIPLYKDINWHICILDSLRNIFSIYKSDIINYELMIRGNLLIIWQLFYNNHLSLVMNSNTPNVSSHIKYCVDYINENYMDNLSLYELAKKAGLSEGHFCRLFKSFTGFTPFNYINRQRISKSCEYLTKTDKKIAEIALLCGYNNISYYNRAFHNLIKESPSSYRKRSTT